MFLFPFQTNKWEDTPVAFDDWTRSHRHESHDDDEDNGDAGHSLHHDRILVRPPPCPIDIRAFAMRTERCPDGYSAWKENES